MMEREFFRPDISRGNWVRRGIFGPTFFKHWENSLPRHQILRPLEQLSNHISQMAIKDLGTVDDDEKFQVSVDVKHFSPEEISVRVVEGHVIVEGKHQEKQDDHGYVSRQFVRRHALPQGCLPDTVQSQLSSDGVLTISAPKVLPMPSIGERIIPITHTGPINKQLSSPGSQIENEAAGEKK